MIVAPPIRVFIGRYLRFIIHKPCFPHELRTSYMLHRIPEYPRINEPNRTRIALDLNAPNIIPGSPNRTDPIFSSVQPICNSVMTPAQNQKNAPVILDMQCIHTNESKSKTINKENNLK
jgi:hypothetical protein